MLFPYRNLTWESCEEPSTPELKNGYTPRICTSFPIRTRLQGDFASNLSYAVRLSICVRTSSNYMLVIYLLASLLMRGLHFF